MSSLDSHPARLLPLAEGEIFVLPRRARIAFVGRCARRVLPLFGASWFGVTAITYGRRLEGVVELVERAASSETQVSLQAGAEAAAVAAVAEIAATCEGSSQSKNILMVVAECVEQAAQVVAGNEEYISNCPLLAYSACCFSTTNKDDPQFARPIRVDFEELRKGAADGRWTDDSPIPHNFCGAFWPDGLPSTWPSSAIAASNAMNLAAKLGWEALKMLAAGHPIGRVGLAIDDFRQQGLR